MSGEKRPFTIAMTRDAILVALGELLRLESCPAERVAIEEEFLDTLVELALGERRVARGELLS